MTYSAVYCALISKRLQNPISKDECYCETHHIIPKSEGGPDSKDNLVNLTAREHYIAHLLLAKIYHDKKMWFALNRLVHGNVKKYTFVTSRMYKVMKETHSKIQSELQKSRTLSESTRNKISESLKGHNGYWSGKQFSTEMRRKISESCKGKNTWVKGRHWYNNGNIELQAFKCPNGFVPGRIKMNDNKCNLY